ncbi:MAG: hypothetical protein K0R25_677, partial [Rickettsiaceae bacterium]|nr:hypothetical protein [Rickettsiaceae bacterium]
QGVRDELWKEQEELGRNFKVVTKEQVKFVDAPLVAAATSDIEILRNATKYLAGEGGSFATLATQLFGLNYLLDSGNTRWQENKIVGITNQELAKAIQNEDEFILASIFGKKSEPNLNQTFNIFSIKDADGNIQNYSYISDFKDLRDVTLQDLTDTKDYSLHGIYNTSDEGFRNGLMQLGTLQKTTDNGLSFVTLNAPTKGSIPDMIENFYNSIFGKTPVASSNIMQLQDFSRILGVVGQYGNITTQTQSGNFNTIQNPTTGIRMAAHSNGGDRLYLGILGGATTNQFIGTNGNSILSVQFYGTPSNTDRIQNAAKTAGLENSNQIQNIINTDDYVGEGLGQNRGGNLI